MVHLQHIGEEYKEKDVVILGFNCSDSREIALTFLKENGITFQNVIDASAEARDVYFDAYHGSAVPINYVIDREGRVAAAFVGYSADERRGPDAVDAVLARPVPSVPTPAPPR